MKKFAAIFAAVLLLVSVFAVSASAKLFSDVDFYSYTGLVSALPHSGIPGSAVSCYRFEVLDTLGNVVFTYGFDEETLIVRNTGSPISAPQFYTVVAGNLDTGIFSPVRIAAGYTFVFYSSVVGSYTGFTRSSFTEPASVSSLGTSVFDVGSSLLAFVSANWLTLVALGAFLVVLCFGAIRRLVKGV